MNPGSSVWSGQVVVRNSFSSKGNTELSKVGGGWGQTTCIKITIWKNERVHFNFTPQTPAQQCLQSTYCMYNLPYRLLGGSSLACPEVSGRGVSIGCDGGAQRHPYVPSAFGSSAGPGARDALMQSLSQALILKSVGLKLFHLGGFLPSIWYGIITKC